MGSAIEAFDERLASLVSLEKVAEDADGVKFTIGIPGPDERRQVNDIILNSTKEMLGVSPDLEAFGYGPEQGCETFRNELAKFLSQQYGDNVASSNLMVTAGATQGMHLILSLLKETSAPILVEDPTYFVSLKIFQKDFNSEVVPVVSDETGMDLDDLDKKLTALKPNAPRSVAGSDCYWAIIYVMTAFSNPRGLVYSAAKSRRLVQLARKHDALIVADDVYNLLWYPPTSPSSKPFAAPPRLLSFDKPSDPDYRRGHVISVGTFSKYLAPGIRLGWLEAPDRILSKLYNSGLAASGGSFNHYMSRLVSVALKSGRVAQHLTGIRIELGKRVNKLCEILENHLPKECSVVKPEGGFYIWLQFPENVDTFEFLQFSTERYGVAFIPGVLASPTEGSHNCARLSISALDEAKIEAGVKELCMAYRDYSAM